MRKSEVVGLIIVFFSIALTIIMYPFMPEQMPSHWNSQDEVVGTTDKDFTLKIFPLVIFGIFTFFVIISRMGDLKPQTSETVFYYGVALNILLLFFFVMHLVYILWNVGIRISVFLVFNVGLGIMLFFLGRVLQHAKPHWFLSFRTPWVKRNEIVWEKTHQLLGKLLCIIGISGAVLGFFTPYASFVIVIAYFSVPFTYWYSYHHYRMLDK